MPHVRPRVQVRVETGGRRRSDGTCEEMAPYAYEGENRATGGSGAYLYGPNKALVRSQIATNWKTSSTRAS